MRYSKLGSSNLSVSRACLGSMTWGVQNTQLDASRQIDYALSRGINFIDTAEMYAVPPSPETYGKTEKIIGRWLSANTHKRQDIVLATKIAGNGLPWIRNGADITGEAIVESVDASLKRLQTDYIDLYQLHWPNRTSPHFAKHLPGKISFSEVDANQHANEMLEILQALQDCVQAGKIRFCGLSDDTPWGINEYLRLAEKHSLPKMTSIQNEFSLIHAKDWPYLIENCVHQEVAFLPWSPLGGGVLSGKYQNGVRPEGSRWSMSQRKGLFRDNEHVHAAVRRYSDIAKQHEMSVSQLSLAWCNQVDGVSSTIIGATTMEQLEENIDAFTMTLNDDALNGIQTVLKDYPMPF